MTVTRSMKKAIAKEMHTTTVTDLNTSGLYKSLNAHIRWCFQNTPQSFTTLDLYEYTLDSELYWAPYAFINENIKLFDVTFDSQNKTVSAIEFEASLDSETNITGIIYNGCKKISGSGMVYNIQTCSYELGQFSMKLLNS
ncbi:hypothetical protein C2G38_2236555 [Gigaspora rosea]|uniref:Uncharacterized protein n=1 Tax=Gigaspora rosea TaxID=44941 RepID=A0A397TXM8_9GLOM|nr:hypothetical protein C2G38_2236555 [Gigaspora rosea]